MIFKLHILRVINRSENSLSLTSIMNFFYSLFDLQQTEPSERKRIVIRDPRTMQDVTSDILQKPGEGKQVDWISMLQQRSSAASSRVSLWNRSFEMPSRIILFGLSVCFWCMLFKLE